MSPEVHRDLLRQLAEQPGGAWITCVGRSMEPTIRLGDRVRIEVFAGAQAGHVVLIAATRAYVLHRVVFCLPGTGWFLHIGDAPECLRPSIAHVSQIVGRAALPRRLAGPRITLAAARRLITAARNLARSQRMIKAQRE